jgi:exodeoxyribonuclease VII large subunit
MNQLPLFEPLLWTVSRVTRYLREILETDDYLQDIWVQGEVSNLSRPASGHLYFTLKDNSSVLKCVMWRNVVMRQSHIPHDGEAIEVHGSINIYETAGQYQLYADLIRPVGQGNLYQEFLRLKAKLEAEGLFDEERKRPIPRWPRTIGVITSPTGAAIRDILNTIKRRYPVIKVILAPTPVQGEDAPAAIVLAFSIMNQIVQPDVIILARGGGSIEDLWPFNVDIVARAIAGSSAPVICGVGHETDFTIADFVSDLRAPTPTAAAELATPNRSDLLTYLTDRNNRINRAMQATITHQHWQLGRLDNRLNMHSPGGQIRTYRQHLDELIHRAGAELTYTLQLQRARLDGHWQHLASLNPESVLNRGYALIKFPDGRLVSSVNQVAKGDVLGVRVSDGEFTVQVKSDISRLESSKA